MSTPDRMCLKKDGLPCTWLAQFLDILAKILICFKIYPWCLPCYGTLAN